MKDRLIDRIGVFEGNTSLEEYQVGDEYCARQREIAAIKVTDDSSNWVGIYDEDGTEMARLHMRYVVHIEWVLE